MVNIWTRARRGDRVRVVKQPQERQTCIKTDKRTHSRHLTFNIRALHTTGYTRLLSVSYITVYCHHI